MASLLGSLAQGLGQGLVTKANWERQDQQRNEDKQWQVDMEERRAKRAEALAEANRQFQLQRDQEQRAFTTEENENQRQWQLDREAQANKAATDQARIKAEEEQRKRAYEARRDDVKYIRERIDELNDRVPTARIKTATDALMGEDADPRTMFAQEDLEALDQKYRLYRSYSPEHLKEAGVWEDYLATKAFFDLQAEEAKRRATPAKTALDPSRQQQGPWVSDNDASSFLSSIINNSGGSIGTTGEVEDLVNSF